MISICFILKLSFNQEICNILDELTKIHGYVLSELDNFRDEQRHVSLGKSSDKKLEDFEKWFCRLLLLFQDLEEIHIPQLELLSELTSLLQDTLRPQSLQQTKDQVIVMIIDRTREFICHVTCTQKHYISFSDQSATSSFLQKWLCNRGSTKTNYSARCKFWGD